MGQNLKTRQKRRRRKLYLKRKNVRIKAGASSKAAKPDKPAKKTVKKAAKKVAKKAAKKAAKKVAKKAAKKVAKKAAKKAAKPKTEAPKATDSTSEASPSDKP